MPVRSRTASPAPRRCVIIGDIRGSSRLDHWPRVFSRLQGSLVDVNRLLASHIALRFTPTVGDEFQGALATPVHAYDACSLLRSGIPARLYLGVGVGAVERRQGGNRGMRGTAFYRARRAVDACKRQGRAILVSSSDTPVPADAALNALLAVAESIEGRWTPRQRELLGYYRAHPRYSFQHLGRRFGVTKQAVSQILAAADWDALVETEAAIRALFGDADALWHAVKLQGFTSGSKANKLYHD